MRVTATPKGASPHREPWPTTVFVAVAITGTVLKL